MAASKPTMPMVIFKSIWSSGTGGAACKLVVAGDMSRIVESLNGCRHEDRSEHNGSKYPS